MKSVSPVVPGLEQFELKIGGPENGQPEYQTLTALRGTDGRVMSRWHLTPIERQAIAEGADLMLTLKTDGLYPPTLIQVGSFGPGESKQIKDDMRLQDELELRLIAKERDSAAQVYKETQAAFERKVAEVYGIKPQAPGSRIQ